MSNVSITIPRWTGEPKEYAEVWTLRKGQRIARCSLRTHPLGGEARLDAATVGRWAPIISTLLPEFRAILTTRAARP